MKTVKRMIAIGSCGLVLGVGASVFGTAPATARFHYGCDKKIDKMEQSAAKDYAKGKMSAKDYAKAMDGVNYLRTLWGC